MAELWQAYGNWIIYGAFFVLMIGHHFFMGHGGHRERERAAGSETAGTDHVHGAAAGGAEAAVQRRRHSGGCH